MRAHILLVTVFYLLKHNDAARDLPKAVVDNIRSHQDTVHSIISLLQGEFKHKAFWQLANFTDKFGHRISGSERLEDCIDYVVEEMEKEGFDNVHTENVTVPYWVRGEEYARLLEPRVEHMQIMGLGSSVGTQSAPDGKLTGEVLVVRTFEELEKRKAEAVGKIVVFNQEWTGYGTTVPYRSGARQASAAGAKGCLIKSVTDFSLYTPHTGWQSYGDETPIPAACITVEDAELMQRLQDLGETIKVEIMMQAQNMPEKQSRNIVAEIQGTEHPEQVVLFGGHIDSWDVGNGVMDDGGGSLISWRVLTIMKKLGLKPKRTMRCVLWTSEEVGLIGAQQYYNDHKVDKDNFVLLMESDNGIFNPLGLLFDGSGLARAYMEEIMGLLAPIDTISVSPGAPVPDLSMWDAEVPKASIDIEADKYFWYHHTDADSISMLNPDHMDLCSMVWTASAYVVANIDDKLPRTGDYPESKTGSPSGAAQIMPIPWLLAAVLLVATILPIRHQ